MLSDLNFLEKIVSSLNNTLLQLICNLFFQERGDSIHPRWLYDFYCEQTGIPKVLLEDVTCKKQYRATVDNLGSSWFFFGWLLAKSESIKKLIFKPWLTN